MSIPENIALTLDRLIEEFRTFEDAVLTRKYWKNNDHYAEDCGDEPCGDCGCCIHGMEPKDGCPVTNSYAPVKCVNWFCACIGVM